MKNSPVFALGLLLCLAAGCGTDIRRVKFQTPALAATPVENKLPLSAALVISPELKDYGIMVNLIGGKARYPVGAQLAKGAQDVAANVFRQVTVVDSEGAAAKNADVVLVPKAVRSEYNITNPLKLLLVMEWTVLDRAGGQTVWLTTIEAEVTETSRLFGHGKLESDIFQRTVDELDRKALKAFQESPEIKRLSSNRQ